MAKQGRGKSRSVRVRCSAEMVVTSRKWIKGMRIGFGGWGARIKPWRRDWHKPGRISVSWGLGEVSGPRWGS